MIGRVSTLAKLTLRRAGRRSDPGRAKAMQEADQARDAKDPARAAVLYRLVLTGWGPAFGVLVQMGNALKDSGAYAEAEQAYRSGLELAPADADCHLQLGHLMKLAGRKDEAEEFYRAANRLDADLAGARAELESIDRQREGDDEQAARSADPPQRLPPDLQLVAVDRGTRAVLIRQRLIGNLVWRRG